MSKTLLFVHVMGAIMWLGGGWVFQIFTELALATADLNRMRGLIQDGERLGKTYFGPLSVIVLGSGVGLVVLEEWGFKQPFIIGGLIGLVLSAGIGSALLGPTVTRVRAAFDAGPSMTPSLMSALRRLRMIGRIDAAIMTAVVFLMTVKPGQ